MLRTVLNSGARIQEGVKVSVRSRKDRSVETIF